MPNLEELAMDMPSGGGFCLGILLSFEELHVPVLERVTKLSLPYNTQQAKSTKLVLGLCPNVTDFRFLWTTNQKSNDKPLDECDPLLHYGPKLKRIQLERSSIAGFEMGDEIQQRIQEFCPNASFTYVDV